MRYVVRNEDDNTYYVGTEVKENKPQLVFTQNIDKARKFMLEELANDTAKYYGRKYNVHLSVVDCSKSDDELGGCDE